MRRWAAGAALLLVFALGDAALGRRGDAAMAGPVIYWTAGVETAARVRQAGLDPIAVPAEKAEAWKKAGLRVVAVTKKELEAREPLLVPRIAGRANVAAATSRPWMDANGWRFQRHPGGTFYGELPAGKAGLAIAEAFAYRVDAILRIDASDLEAAGAVFAFLRGLPGEAYAPVADFAVADDGSDAVGEVLNLLTRRNLLYDVPPRAGARYPFEIRLGTKDFPQAEAADPSAFATRVRRQLGDDARSLRVYGTETVIARYLRGDGGFRVHLVNYTNGEIEGLRVRLRGAPNVRSASAWALGVGGFALEAPEQQGDAYEFSIPRMRNYAVIDGTFGKS